MAATTNRISLWFSSGAFATIALVALLKDIGDVGDQKKEIKWGVSGISVALSLAGLAIFANMLLREKFVGAQVEGGMAVMTFGMWCVVLPAIMDPDNGMAMMGDSLSDEKGRVFVYINNFNLYFFSWLATIMSLFALTGYMRHKANEMKSGAEATFQYGSWAALTLTSFIVMVAAARQFDDLKCDEYDNTICGRTRFAVALGAVSAAVSLVYMLLGLCITLSNMIETVLAVLLLVAWILGVTYITFGGENKQAAYELGNLYFFTWGSFGVVCSRAAKGIFDMFGMAMKPAESTDAAEEKKEDMPEDKPVD
jgi:hypothetical protein